MLLNYFVSSRCSHLVGLLDRPCIQDITRPHIFTDEFVYTRRLKWRNWNGAANLN
jgi:hypothetical protein